MAVSGKVAKKHVWWQYVQWRGSYQRYHVFFGTKTKKCMLQNPCACRKWKLSWDRQQVKKSMRLVLSKRTFYKLHHTNTTNTQNVTTASSAHVAAEGLYFLSPNTMRCCKNDNKNKTKHISYDLATTICIKKWKLDRAGNVVGLKSSDNLIVYIDKITLISCCMLFVVSWVPCLESWWNQQIFSESKWQCLPLSPTTSAPLRESPKCKHSIEELQRSCLLLTKAKVFEAYFIQIFNWQIQCRT